MKNDALKKKQNDFLLNSLPKPFFVLGPMDDVTDTVFRQIIISNSKPDLFITEFVNVDGLQSPGRPKLIHKLAFSKEEKPIIAQIWGLNPENFYKTTKELKKKGFSGVDINMGCPIKTVVKNGACAALINNRDLAGRIIDRVREAAGESFPVSVKTRIGFGEVDLSWIEFLLKKKLNMLIIHGRTAKQLSKVPADWDTIGKIRQMRDELSPATLIVGNGDVLSRAQGEKLASKYSLDGIMIGRGIFEDPFVFSVKSPWRSYTKQQKIDLYRRHAELFGKTYKAETRKIHTLNKFCKVYITGFDGAKEMREQLMNATSAKKLLQLIDELS